jgi:hypothetical protein
MSWREHTWTENVLLECAGSVVTADLLVETLACERMLSAQIFLFTHDSKD